MGKNLLLKEYFSNESTSLFNMLFGEVEDLMTLTSTLRKNITDFILSVGEEITDACIHKSAIVDENVYLGNGTVVEPFVYIKGPSIIGSNVTVRKGAYIREFSLVDHNCIIGSSVEIKESIIMSNTHIPHLSYVGNSIIGNGVLLGAGFKGSNEKLSQTHGIKIFISEDEFIQTDFKKFGCVVGDKTRVGCNVVVCPGSVIGREVIVYPSIVIRGFLPHKTIVKLQNNLNIIVERRWEY